VRIEVGNSQNLVLHWNTKRVKWDVFEGGASSSVLSRGGWHLLVFAEPRRVGVDNTPVPNSAAARAYRNSVYIENLHRNVQRRDAMNTDPVVFTTTSKTIMGASARPMYDGPRDGQSNIMGETRHDHSQWLAERLESFRTFDALSKKARLSTQSAMTSVSQSGGVWGKTSDVHSDQFVGSMPEQARELFITDGRDAHEMSERKAPQNFDFIEKQLRQGIFKAHGVPLQATGESVNSERLASSDRLSQMAIGQFDTHLKNVRSAIQGALDKLSSIVVRQPGIVLRLWPCVSAFDLSQIEPILTTDAALRLNQCLYNHPKHYFDRAKIAIRQEIMLEGAEPDGSPGETGSKGHKSNKGDAGKASKGVRPAKKKAGSMTSKAKTQRKEKKAQ
jgi:hypothetical protein